MSDREEEEQMVDPPENQPGGGKAELDSTDDTARAVDPPSSDGGN